MNRLPKKILDRLIRFRFDERDHEKGKACSICLQAYEADEMMLGIGCQGRDLFHETCATRWFKKSHRCPLCQEDLNLMFQSK